jgi:hypothetical protein
MAHEGLLTVFVIVTALAVVMQAAVLYAMFRVLKLMFGTVQRIDSDFKNHINPVLDSVRAVTTAAREPMSAILANLNEVTVLLRRRAVDADALAADVMQRARVETVRIDELLAATLERLERAADAAERGVLVPVRELAALITGLRQGFAFFFSRQRSRTKPGGQRGQEEQLFI